MVIEMSGIDEQQVKKVTKVNASKQKPSNRELDEWNAFVRGYLPRNLYLGPSKALIIAELFVGMFILSIVGLFITRTAAPGLFLLTLIIFSVIPLYWGGDNLGKYLRWRARRNEWLNNTRRKFEEEDHERMLPPVNLARADVWLGYIRSLLKTCQE